MPERASALRLLTKTPSSADTIVLGVRDVDGKPTLYATEEFAYVADLLARTEASGSLDAVSRIPDPADSKRALVLTGLGTADVTPDSLRHALGAAMRKATPAKSIAIAVPTPSLDHVSAIAEGAALGRYSFTEFRTKRKSAASNALGPVAIVTTLKSQAVIARADAHAQAVAVVKDLVNTPPNVLSPDELAHRAVTLVKGLPIRVKVWDEKQLHKEGFGGIVGVGQGSSRPPRLVRLTYSPAKRKKHIAFVGKGITFDTGGLSLKPASSMLGMKYDMTGAATVLGVIRAVATLELPVAVTAWMCIAENMPSGTAIRPNDVLRMLNGTTVEVTNTDAEGRLVLADGLVAAEKEKPDLIVDIATLTGAASVALGTRYAGAMGDASAVESFLAAAKDTGELFWPMPIPDEMRAMLNSEVADIMNAKVGNTAGGMLLGAAFLREFVERTPWVHLDIASSANNAGSAFGFTGSGPTGSSVRALIRLAELESAK